MRPTLIRELLKATESPFAGKIETKGSGVDLRFGHPKLPVLVMEKRVGLQANKPFQTDGGRLGIVQPRLRVALSHYAATPWCPTDCDAC